MRLAVLKHGGNWPALIAFSLLLTAVLEWAAFPAAFLLGPMIAAMVIAIGGAPVRLQRMYLVAAQAIIGCRIAQALTSSILVSFAADWATMLLVVSTTVLAGAVVGWVLVRFGSLPGTTAAWGSSPGAAVAMIAMAEEFGADTQLVAFMQYMRVVIVVLSASIVSRMILGSAPPEAVVPQIATLFEVAPKPFMATLLIAVTGVLLARRLRIPGGALLLPMLIGAGVHTSGIVEISLPPVLTGVAYAVLGWHVGLSFTRKVFLHAFHAIPQLLLSTLLLIALCGFSAWLLTMMLHTDALTAYLATSPGGLDAIGIIAISSRVDISFVMAIQILRVFVVIFTGPQIAKLICRYAQPR